MFSNTPFFFQIVIAILGGYAVFVGISGLVSGRVKVFHSPFGISKHKGLLGVFYSLCFLILGILILLDFFRNL